MRRIVWGCRGRIVGVGMGRLMSRWRSCGGLRVLVMRVSGIRVVFIVFSFEDGV